MTKYEVKRTSRFEKDYKLLKKQGRDVSLLEEPVSLLADGLQLPAKYNDHSLKGNLKASLSVILPRTGC